MTDAQVLEYASILDRIEDHYGFPVDTEWALAEGTFHVLQARPITTLAREYRDPIVDESQSWVRGMRRPLSLMEASILAHWLDCQHVGDDIGLQIDRFLSIQDTSDLTTMFFPQQEFLAGLNYICDLDRQDRDRLVTLLQRANEIYRHGFERVSAGEGFEDLDDAVEHLIEVGRYTTSLPPCTLNALELGHIDDPQVRVLAEGLRSNSLYPRYLSRLVEPLVRQVARRLDLEEPDRAPELLTWRELHAGGIDQQVLHQRLCDVRAGYRFVYQFLGSEERVNFVSETGYLLMRESGHRQIVPPDDPDRISGHAAWPGVHRGRARVILKSEPEGYELDDGEVLVSIQSNPNLMPLLRHAGAIVTDDGGVACHAGIICRELKIPTIIGTGRATSAIHDGDLVEVDATEQVVRILQRANTPST